MLSTKKKKNKQTASASINRLQQETCSEYRDFISIKIEAILWRNCKESSHFWRFGAEVGESSGRLKVAPLGAGVEESVEEACLALCEFEACCGAALKSERIVTRAVEVVDVLFRVERVNNLKENTTPTFQRFFNAFHSIQNQNKNSGDLLGSRRDRSVRTTCFSDRGYRESPSSTFERFSEDFERTCLVPLQMLLLVQTSEVAPPQKTFDLKNHLSIKPG